MEHRYTIPVDRSLLHMYVGVVLFVLERTRSFYARRQSRAGGDLYRLAGHLSAAP